MSRMNRLRSTIVSVALSIIVVTGCGDDDGSVSVDPVTVTADQRLEIMSTVINQFGSDLGRTDDEWSSFALGLCATDMSNQALIDASHEFGLPAGTDVTDTELLAIASQTAASVCPDKMTPSSG